MINPLDQGKRPFYRRIVPLTCSAFDFHPFNYLKGKMIIRCVNGPQIAFCHYGNAREQGGLVHRRSGRLQEIQGLSIALCAAPMLVSNGRGKAKIIGFTVTGWGTGCGSTTYMATSTACTFMGNPAGSALPSGTINGTDQFVDNSFSGGTLTVVSSIYCRPLLVGM